MSESVRFRLNGRLRTVEYESGMTLLDVLREVCGITSPKNGCSQGMCGCCSVLLDGRPTLSCQLEPHRVADREVVTLEGLPARMRELLVQAFAREGAVQCGFCTPGIAIRASHLVTRGLTSDRARVQRGLAGHLCRCTGYHRIVDAIQTAGEAWSSDRPVGTGPPRRSDFFGEHLGLRRTSPPPLVHGVGASEARYLVADQVLGRKAFVADLGIDGLLHGALVLADHPRARVVAVDTSAALSQPGVVGTVVASDIPGERFHGLIVRDWPLMIGIGETTRCVGDVLAVVVAESAFRARKAAELVTVSYDVLEPVASPEEALAETAPPLHPGGNVLDVCAFARGDVDRALAASAHVVEETFSTQRIEHAFLEPEAAVAVPQGDGLRIYSQGQGVHDDQRQIAAILGLEPASVDVELVSNGGAFGGKEDLSVQGHAALAAWVLRRPVRVVLSREQSLRMHPKRHPLTLHYTAGCDEEGRLTAVRARIVGDTGAYASVGSKVLERAAGHSCGPYRVANVDVEAMTVYTNNPPCGAMRGFGVNQAAFAIEGIMDRLAERVGLDGYDIRERNILGPGDRFATGQRMDESCGIRRTLEAVREVYKSASRAGIACGLKNTGIGNGQDDVGRVSLEISGPDEVEIVTGYTEMGQGLHTILRQVVGHETGLDPEIMKVRTASRADVVCGMTTASRATALAGAACRIAARELAAALGESKLSELVGRRFRGEFVCDVTTPPGTDVENPVTHMAFGYATQVAVLTEHGTIERVVAAHDVGRAVNPQSCVGQIEGAIHMGLGYALSEDFPCIAGFPDTLNVGRLGILRASEMPPVEVVLIEVPDAIGGYGAKGVGEIGLVPTAGAVAAALHAWDGRWRSVLPMRDATTSNP